MMKTSTITISSVFETTVAEMFPLLQQLRTLQTIAAPYATFQPLDGREELLWQPGQTFQFRLRLFGLVSFGVHTIEVVSFSPENILTHEGNPHVPVWNHRITLEPLDDRTLRYTDQVEIGAGWKTPFVCLWARLFYRHRQRGWRRLLSADAA